MKKVWFALLLGVTLIWALGCGSSSMSEPMSPVNTKQGYEPTPDTSQGPTNDRFYANDLAENNGENTKSQESGVKTYQPPDAGIQDSSVSGTPSTSVPPTNEKKEQNPICQLPFVPGACKSAWVRYGFSVKVGKCVAFSYTGCEGNANRFETLQECQQACE